MSKITPTALVAAMRGDMENFMAATTPGGIEAQEKRGQIEQSFCETLPIKGTEKREVWEKLGFVFGKTVDQIFVEAKFPKDWRKQPTDHEWREFYRIESNRFKTWEIACLEAL